MALQNLTRRELWRGAAAAATVGALGLGGCATSPSPFAAIPANSPGSLRGIWIYDIGRRELRSADNRFNFTAHSGTIGIALPDGEIVAYSRHQNSPIADGVRVHAIDNSAFEIVPEVGPICEETYAVSRQDYSTLGRAVIHLEPQRRNAAIVFGRSDFRIHVIEPDELGTAGCIGIPYAGQNGMTGAQIVAYLQKLQESGQFRTLHVISSCTDTSRQMRAYWSEGHNLAFLRQHNDAVIAAVAPALRPGGVPAARRQAYNR